MAHFDETSGVVPCKTEFGSWWQTIDEVFIEIVWQEPLKSKDISCSIQPNYISVSIKDKCIVKGTLYEPIHADEAIWTIEDKFYVRICLSKCHNNAEHCWPSLMKDRYQADPAVFDEMEKKLTLQRFQHENPGMDFSGASLTGNYHGGGPQLPEYSSS